MGKARKVGWALSLGKVDWREADKRAAHNSKLLLKEVKQQGRTAASRTATDADVRNLEGATPVIEVRGPVSTAPARPAAPAPADRIELLAKLGALRDSGVLTEEEFQLEKKRVLTSTEPTKKPQSKPKASAAKPAASAPDLRMKADAHEFGDDDPKDGTAFSREVRAKQTAFKKGWLTEAEYEASLTALRKKHKRSSPVRSGAWHPDPTGRHEHRYWDGSRWTQHVSDSGVAAIDPVAP